MNYFLKLILVFVMWFVTIFGLDMGTGMEIPGTVTPPPAAVTTPAPTAAPTRKPTEKPNPTQAPVITPAPTAAPTAEPTPEVIEEEHEDTLLPEI